MHPLLLSCIGAIFGLGMHHAVFIHGEWHIQAPDIVIGHIVALICLQILLEQATWIILGYFVALIFSILIYRVFFHRLGEFPGPLWARMSKLGHVWKARDSKNHLFLEGLRQEYGDFVRTGPSELTVYLPEAYAAIDGPLTKCDKAEWYDVLWPSLSILTVRVKEIHSMRRKQWSRAFTPNALRHYHERIIPLLDQLDSCIQSDIAAGRVTEGSELCYWLSFDRMGDLIFGKSFGMLSDKKWHHIIVLLQRATSLLGPTSPAPWILQITFRLLPRVSILRDWFTMRRWCEEQMVKRMGIPPDASKPTDISEYLIEDGPKDLANQPWISGDSVFAIVAGSDPSAAALIMSVALLAEHPDDAEKIWHELQNVDPDDPQALAKDCPHLQAVIFEALRLFPVLATGGSRKTSTEGITIGGRFIPPETTIIAPRYSIARREDCFERPNEFIPERWYKYPEMVRNKAAFAPFATGHNACLGKALAMADLRLIVARLVRKYRFRYPKGETFEAVQRDWKDQTTSRPGNMRLIFEARQT